MLRPFTSLASFVNLGVPDSALVGMLALHLSPGQAIPPTHFPSNFGNVVALVVLGSSVQIKLPSMDTSLRVPSRSILILEHIRYAHHELLAEGDCYMVMLFEPDHS